MTILMPFLTLICLLALPVFLIKPGRKRAETLSFMQTDYAHRGLYDNTQAWPENSIPAFARAVAKGYGIELDVQLTADGHVVVFHDFDLQRACGVDRILTEMPLAELQQLRLFDSQETIPLLSDVLELVAGQVPLIIELKIEDKAVAPLCQAVRQVLATYTGSYCIESFSPLAVTDFRRHAPEVIRGQLSGNLYGRKGLIFWLLRNLWLNLLSQPDFIAYEVGYHHNRWLRLIKKLYHTPLIAFTTQNLETYQRQKDFFTVQIFEQFEPPQQKS